VRLGNFNRRKVRGGVWGKGKMRVDEGQAQIGQVPKRAELFARDQQQATSSKQQSVYVERRYVVKRLRCRGNKTRGTPVGGDGMYDLREWLNPSVG
jgi:hypothetical protein